MRTSKKDRIGDLDVEHSGNELLEPIELVMHFGLPKTATTSLQSYWRQLDNYIGTGGYYHALSEDLLDIFAQFGRGIDVKRKLKAWYLQLIEWRLTHNIAEPIILSDEQFMSGQLNHMIEFPIYKKGSAQSSELLGKFIEMIGSRDFGWSLDPVIIITIRNQAEWVCSKYAQASNKIFRADQYDFELRITDFVKNEDAGWCDWSIWVDRMDRAVGASNVHVMCLEEMQSNAFWENVAKISHSDSGTSQSMRQNSVRGTSLNKKRLSHQKWTLSRFNLGNWAAKRLAFRPRGKAAKLLSKAGFLLNILSGQVSYFNTPKSLEMPESLSVNVVRCCGLGNAWLEVRLRKDLRSLGYAVVRSDERDEEQQ